MLTSGWLTKDPLLMACQESQIKGRAASVTLPFRDRLDLGPHAPAHARKVLCPQMRHVGHHLPSRLFGIVLQTPAHS